MSLSSAASLAQSGLNTVTAEISVLSRNISGASDTSIYSEKTANVITGPGGASQVASITRATNQAVFQNLLGATSANATQSALLPGINTLNETIGNLSSSSSSSTTSSASSPSALLSNFTDALQSYEASPSDSTLAGAAVAAAVTLAQGLNSATATVNQVREQADSGIATSVQTINSLLTQFQTANAQIVNGTATGADITNAQDTRSNILTQLAQQIGIATTTSANGSMSIYTDSGATLFQGGVARSVTFSPTSTYTPSTTGNAVYVDGVPITGASASMPISSGNIAGLANLRDNLTVTSYCLREKCSRTPVCCLIINAPGRRGFSLTLSVRFPRSKPLATRAFHCAVASERLAPSGLLRECRFPNVQIFAVPAGFIGMAGRPEDETLGCFPPQNF